jgi:hypothetical protein
MTDTITPIAAPTNASDFKLELFQGFRHGIEVQPYS